MCLHAVMFLLKPASRVKALKGRVEFKDYNDNKDAPRKGQRDAPLSPLRLCRPFSCDAFSFK